MSGKVRPATCLLVLSLLVFATTAAASSFTELKSSKNPSNYGQSVTFTALISGASTGNVAFEDTTTSTSLSPVTFTSVPATNLLWYSSRYATGAPPTPAAPWSVWTLDSQSDFAVNSTGAPAPDGSSTATTFAVTNVGADNGAGIGIDQTVSYASGIVTHPFTASVFLRSTAACEITIGVETSPSATVWDGGSTLITTSTAWQRYSFSHTFAQDDVALVFFLYVPTNCTLDMWGAQLEQADSEGPYVPTTNASANGTGARATVLTAALSGGPHVITATYSGDGSSATLTQTVYNQTVTELRGSPNPSTTKQKVTLTAVVHTGGGGVPTGTVAFRDETTATDLGTGPVDVSPSTASNQLIHSDVFDSAWSIWDGDDSYTLDTTSAFAPDGNPTATGFTAGTSDLYIGQSVSAGSSVNTRTFTASVFLRSDNGCTATVGTETPVTWDGNSISVALSAGWQRYVVTHTFADAGDGSTLALYLNVPAGCIIYLWGPQLEEASSAGPYAATDAVPVTDGSGGIAMLADIALTSDGPHTITATYVPDGNSKFELSSTVPPSLSAGTLALTQTVNLPTDPTVELVSAPNPSAYEESVNLSATVSGPVGDPVPTGSVKFYDGATLLGGGPLNLTDGWTSLNCPSTNPPCATLSVGSHSFTAEYSGDDLYAAKTSAPAVILDVTKDDTTMLLESDQNPAGYGASVTFTATLSGTKGGGTPTGTVVFKADGNTICPDVTCLPISLSTGYASVSISTLALGSHAITATYSGDSNFNASSGSLTQSITGNLTTTTTLNSSRNPSNYGEQVSFEAVVATQSGGTPTGSITFLDGSTALAPAVPLTGDWATLTCPSASQGCAALATGTHSIKAQYSGDPAFLSSVSAVVSQVVNKRGSTTVLQSSANPVAYGGALNFTATVTTTAGGAASGTVTFSDVTDPLHPVSLGSGQLSSGWITVTPASPLAVGSHTITAVYAGDTNTSGSQASLTQDITGNVSTTIVLQASTTSAAPGTTITFTATVSPGSGPTGSVTFKEGSTILGTATLGAGWTTLNVSTLAPGSHSITALYSGDANFASSTSAAVTIDILAGSVATTTKLEVSSTSAAAGTSITFTATVTPSSGGPATGSVTFKDGSTTLGTGTLTPAGYTTLNKSDLSVGSHSITAVYGGDTTFAGSTSAAVTVQIVGQDFSLPPPSSNPAKTVTAGQPAQWSITVTPAAGGFTGLVQFACTSWSPLQPTGAACSFSPQSVTPGSSPVTTTLTITTAPRSTALNRPTSPWRGLPLYAVFFPVAGVVMIGGVRRQSRGLLLVLALVLLALLVSCGGGSMGPPPTPSPTPTGTPAGTYTVTVAAQSGSTTHTTTVSLIVQ